MGAVRGALRARPETLRREAGDEGCAAQSFALHVSMSLVILGRHRVAHRVGEKEADPAVTRG